MNFQLHKLIHVLCLFYFVHLVVVIRLKSNDLHSVDFSKSRTGKEKSSHFLYQSLVSPCILLHGRMPFQEHYRRLQQAI